ncbi:hypothetical protein P4W10_27870, partial [Bacillus thuringiensis]|nr:hypothetical protein [Bacillus thuringiensis]MED2155878.1 hypothetical protein [Bacillus thuringiensis]MED2199592.1 hypothetical protein [Bacillus thuringiensis]MED2232130.1 hypothetical protein [Bacillus thuringiensis]MED2240941.1 hypothetical protein [Bacillus thuringiensis]
MSYDTVASLQRMQQLEQAQAATGKRLILKRIDSNTERALIILGLLLMIPTLGISIMLVGIYALITMFVRKTYLVKNVATGEKFRVDKQDFKQYKKNFKKKEKQ